MESSSLKIYTDGGSRGNPGEAAIGVVIANKYFYKKAIGIKTNNQAEYEAVIFALKKIKQIYGKEKCKNLNLIFYSDSELMVNQLNGLYKIKEEELKNLFIEIWNLKQDFKEVEFKLIKREENKLADKLVNEALDELLIKQ